MIVDRIGFQIFRADYWSCVNTYFPIYIRIYRESLSQTLQRFDVDETIPMQCRIRSNRKFWLSFVILLTRRAKPLPAFTGSIETCRHSRIYVKGYVPAHAFRWDGIDSGGSRAKCSACYTSIPVHTAWHDHAIGFVVRRYLFKSAIGIHSVRSALTRILRGSSYERNNISGILLSYDPDVNWTSLH